MIGEKQDILNGFGEEAFRIITERLQAKAQTNIPKSSTIEEQITDLQVAVAEIYEVIANG